MDYILNALWWLMFIPVLTVIVGGLTGLIIGVTLAGKLRG